MPKEPHLAAQQCGVHVERDMRPTAQTLNPAHAVNQAAFNGVGAVVLSPREAVVKKQYEELKVSV